MMITQLKNKLLLGAAAATIIFVGGGTVLIAHAQGAPTPTPPAQMQSQSQVETGEQDAIQDPSYSASITVNQGQNDGMSEKDEAANLQKQAIVTPAEAEAAALAANPGATVVKTELDNENGALVYSVELGSGLDVKVDAANAAILHTEQAGNDQAESGDADNVQEEVQQGSQMDDATETAVVEDAPGQ